MWTNILDENPVIGSFAIPSEPLAPIAMSVLPANKELIHEKPAVISQPILSVPLEQQPSVESSEQPASPSVKQIPSVSEPAQSIVDPAPVLQAEQVINIPVLPSAQPQQPTKVPQSARAKPSSNVLFSMEVSKALEGAPSLQQAVEEAFQNDEEEGSGVDDEEVVSGENSSEGGVTEEESFEEITYSCPRATYSEDSQSDSSDAEWYALIHSRRPKDNNQPPQVTNIPSSRNNRHRDDRYDDRRDRRGDRRSNRNRDDQRARDEYRPRNEVRPREELRGGNRERLARYDPAEAQAGPYFVPVNNLKQREEHRMRMRGQREDVSSGSSSYSEDSYTSPSSDDEGRRHRHHGHRHGRRRAGYFERLVRKIPRKVTDL